MSSLFRKNSVAEVGALWRRERLASSRLSRTPWLLAATTVASGAFLLLVGIASSDPSSDLGRKLFHLHHALATIFATLIGPALAANAIALEREGKTWDALVMAGVRPRSLDRGKFLGSYTHLCVYLLALLPAAGVPHLFGGVTLTETLLAIGMVFVIGALAVRFGLFMSSLVPTTRTALLATLCASAALCFLVVVGGLVATDVLRRQIGMRSLESDPPIFWPVALVHEPLSFDYLRYLVIIPVGASVVSWFCLRELTVHALAGVRARPHRLTTYLAIIGAFAVLFGLIPNRPREVIVAEVLFALVSFGAIMVMNADPPARGTSLPRSIVLMTAGSAGIFVVLAVASFVQPDLADRIFDGAPNYLFEPLENMVVYGPAFTVFVAGLAAFVRTVFRRSGVRHATTAGITVAIAVVPMLVAVFLKATGHSVQLALAASPVGALAASNARGEIVSVSAIWCALGAALLVLTHRRERIAAVAAKTADIPISSRTINEIQ